ncbi:hypothetical protein BUALT_Bualt09G0034700 [Buddleja alternifolia]|uniref:C3H1-type domain-containing protein n=1 Tax=Buddleja alternifolia TaxID=168488 RepID=A0AAV6X1F6_9LAMI|nr:hypothetical protein BUALT_Bualt09G0034700 [Buddleja alternifolia]
MEDSTLQTVTLNPSQTAFTFAPHRRRPLRSNTCRTLSRILSHCTNVPQLQTQDGSGDVESRPVGERNGSINYDGRGSVDLLIPTPNCKEFEDKVVRESSTGTSKENPSFEDGGYNGEQTTVPDLDHINLVIDGEQEVTPANRLGSEEDFLVVEERTGDSAVQITKEGENMNTDIDNINIDDFGPLEQLEVDNEFSIPDFSEVFDSCFGVDMVESSKGGEDSEENGTSLEESRPKEAEHELQLKEMELEKPIHNSGVEPSSCRTADEEIEEGEISGEVWVADESIDALTEDAVSLGGRNSDMSSLVNTVNNENNCMQVKLITTAGQTLDFHSQNVFYDSYMETPRTGSVAPSLKNLTPSGRILTENAAENQFSTTTEKNNCHCNTNWGCTCKLASLNRLLRSYEVDQIPNLFILTLLPDWSFSRSGLAGDARQKKRKNGPLTEERRAKKKKKNKIRKAEKNRQLGVKRLKLQPVLKPKTIVYCRHYLQGRCHEGEKCKYSHDTVPLTKSKPCGHFARHACMKGEDCPFDHQLSKYPCTNYTSTGFCSRGSDCLFSHEMTAKQSSPTTPSVSQNQLESGHPTMPDKEGSLMLSKTTSPKLKFQSPLGNSNSSNLSFQKVDAKFRSSGNAPGKNTNLLTDKAISRTPGQAPKGVSFLSNRGMSLGETNKPKQNGSLVTTSKVPEGVNKSNDMSEGVPPRRPQGINFLSFAQPSLDDISIKQTCSLPESRGVLKVHRQMNPSASCSVPGPNKEVNGTPLTMLQHLNFFSFDKTQLDNSIFKERANDHFNKGDFALSLVNGRQSTSSKLQDAMKTPSNPFGRLWHQSTDGNNSNVSNSFKTSSILSNTPSLVQKAVQSTLAFAANFDIKARSSLHQWRS